MKKLILALILLTFVLAACSVQVQPQQPVDKSGADYKNVGQQFPDTPQQPAAEPTPVKSNVLEIVVGEDGKQYNGNSEPFYAGGVVTYPKVNRDYLTPEKFYLENVWSVLKDNSYLWGDQGNLVIMTKAKKVSIQASAPGMVDLVVYKQVSPVPKEEFGKDLSTSPTGEVGLKVFDKRVYNLIDRTSNTAAVYDIHIGRTDFRVYKIILEY